VNSFQNHPTPESSNQSSDDSVTRRDLARKAAYVAPAVLAVIAAAERPLIAQSGGSPPPM